MSLTTIMAALATLENTIPPPPLSQAVTPLNVTNEPADIIDSYPTMVNWERKTDVVAGRGTPTFGTNIPQEYTHYVDAALVLADGGGSTVYTYANKRLWFEVVLDALRQNPTLSGACGGVYVDSVDHDNARIPKRSPYPGLTFHLHILAAG